MRLRHVLLTCAALPMLAQGLPAGAAAAGAATQTVATAPKGGMTPAELAQARTSIRQMIDNINIAYQEFTLPNGLRVLVHTDATAPDVYVGIWYDVGSKHEPVGRSGFAHLFEHLMFNGSENVPGDYMAPLASIGAQVNGSTSSDRTNYYQVVPAPALDRALFMESDRMGHLLGALNQATLDEQRGVVQNEKRQGANSPSSIVPDMARLVMFPSEHPYDHSIIGSMKDLNAATLDDVGAFFKAHYGPNNATLMLAGNIDVATAKQLVTKYFGDIPAGPRNVRPTVEATPLTKTIKQTVTAPINRTMIVRQWRVPGTYSDDALALDGATIGLTGSIETPFYKHLVLDEKLFDSVQVANSTLMHGGTFAITGWVREGVDPKVAAAALDREFAKFLKDGPTEQGLLEWVAGHSYGTVRGLETSTSRGEQMGETLSAYGDPLAFKRNLRFYADLTPAAVRAASKRWLDKPRWELVVSPGPRVTLPEDAGIDGTPVAQQTTPQAPKPAPAATPAAQPVATGNRGPLPAVGPVKDIPFPAIEHATLANGMPVTYARVQSIPYTSVNIKIQGGSLHEAADEAGTMSTMYSMLGTGFGNMDERAIRERTRLLGVSLSASGGQDDSGIGIDAPDANLVPALDLLRTIVTAPTFPQEPIDRWQRQSIEGLKGAKVSANRLINETLLPLIDAGSPYNRDAMQGDAARIRRTDRNALLAAYRRWVRPEGAKLFVASGKPLAELLPLLNASIGTWKSTTSPTPLPKVEYRPQPATPQIVLIDLPGAVQATIEGGQRVTVDDQPPIEALALGERVLGEGFTSRINMNLREDKHWAYGASGGFDRRPYSSRYTVNTTVQQDKAGPAIAELTKEIRRIVGNEPITTAEFDAVQTAVLGQQSNRSLNRYMVLNTMQWLDKYNQPGSFASESGKRIRAVTVDEANAALKSQLDPSKWVWAVTGNAALIRPQFDALGLPVRVVKADDVFKPVE
ncbi:pitrilysin family protein [Sphingomonas sp. GM_Shp_2]|uniref:M16 family metallopeptidase n=1 Tax=Sphingomonas sp. GM_Shp_2 TaxID=2937380 RepID=UPI00226ACFAB|nr:pitrilysin family protein [Sphingomonas sp. GM_Shp_2]